MVADGIRESREPACQSPTATEDWDLPQRERTRCAGLLGIAVCRTARTVMWEEEPVTTPPTRYGPGPWSNAPSTSSICAKMQL